MLYKGHYLSGTKWIPVQILNIDDFLKENRFNLRAGLIQSGINRLNSLRLHPYELNLGGCKINIVGTKEAIEVIPSIEYALKNYMKKQ